MGMGDADVSMVVPGRIRSQSMPAEMSVWLADAF
jgi:hypothetical protein